MNVDKLITKALKETGIPCSKLFWNDELNIPNQYVTWSSISTLPKLSADDKELVECHYISVSVFSRYGTSYATAVDKIEESMIQNGFLKSSYGSEKYEKDTGYVHKPLSFKYYKQKQ